MKTATKTLRPQHHAEVLQHCLGGITPTRCIVVTSTPTRCIGVVTPSTRCRVAAATSNTGVAVVTSNSTNVTSNSVAVVITNNINVTSVRTNVNITVVTSTTNSITTSNNGFIASDIATITVMNTGAINNIAHVSWKNASFKSRISGLNHGFLKYCSIKSRNFA